MVFNATMRDVSCRHSQQGYYVHISLWFPVK